MRSKKPFKKVTLRTIAALVAMIMGLFIWLILPSKGIEITQLVPQETFTFLSLKIDSKDSGTSELLNNFNWRIRWGVRLLGPVEIAALAAPTVNKEEPDYLFLVKNGRLIRVVRLFRRSIDKAMIDEESFERIDYRGCRILHLKGLGKEDEVSSYTLFRDIALASNNLSLLKASLDQYGGEATFISGEALDDFGKWRELGDGMLFISNIHFDLSYLIKSLEEKSVYAIFPSVNSVQWLGGYFDILDADNSRGALTFKYKEEADMKKGEGDVRFLAGILRRLCKAHDINFTYGIMTDNNYINLNFKISGLRLLTTNLLIKEEKK